jgi:hypothetical protein
MLSIKRKKERKKVVRYLGHHGMYSNFLFTFVCLCDLVFFFPFRIYFTDKLESTKKSKRREESLSSVMNIKVKLKIAANTSMWLIGL